MRQAAFDIYIGREKERDREWERERERERAILVTNEGNGYGNQVKIQDQIVYTSHGANTLGKNMNPSILPPTMGKIIEQFGIFNFGIATVLEKENSLFKPVKLRINIDLVSHSVRKERQVNAHIQGVMSKMPQLLIIDFVNALCVISFSVQQSRVI